MLRSLSLLPWFALVCVAAPALLADDPPAAAPAGPTQFTVVTADEEQITASILGVENGELKLATEPARSIPLAEILRVEVGGQAAAATPASTGDLTWVGQDNHDLVQVGGASGGNGIQDIHLRASALRPVGLKQIIIVCRFPKQLRVWRLDTSQSPHWRVAVARADLAPEADLYLEPPADDAFGQKFDLTYTYNDGVTAKSSVTATTHTSDKTKVLRTAQAGQVAQPEAAEESAQAEVVLFDGGRVRGEVKALDAETLTIHTRWKAELPIPLVRAKGLWFGNTAPPGTLAVYEKQMAAPGDQDTVFVLAPDKSLAQIQASVRGLADGKLQVKYDGADRGINRERVLAVVFAAHPPLAAPTGPVGVFQMAAGDVLVGAWTGFADNKLEIETAWNGKLSLPVSALGAVRIRNGKLTFLPDLEPVAVEETGYFGRVIPWRRDEGFDGDVPRVRSKQPTRSIAMHSRSSLTFALEGQYDKFKATLGFDDSAGTRGRVACRILVDGREVFADKDFRATSDPQEIDISVAGARQMTLEVDFGEEQDVGDRIVWAEPRLFRAAGKP